MNFDQIQILASGSFVSQHKRITGAKSVLLEADSRCRILLFTEADCMLSMKTMLLSLEPDSLVAIPPNVPAELKMGSGCRYWELAFHGDTSLPLLRQIFYRWSALVHLGESDRSIGLFFPQLRSLMEAKLQGVEDSVLCYDMAFGTLLYNCSACLSKGLEYKLDLYRPIAHRIKEYVDEHYSENLSLELLEGLFFVSRHHICRQFRAAFGKTLMEYLRNLRVDRARELLLTTNLSTAEIGRACGFATAQSFHAAFSRLMGTTPLQYRKNGGRSGAPRP